MGRRWLPLMALIMLLAVGAWCWLRPPIPPPPAERPGPTPVELPPAPEWLDSFAGLWDDVYLLPVGPRGAARRPAQEVWNDLLPGMKSDPDTLRLLRRLYNELPVELVVLPAEQAKDPRSLERAAGPPQATSGVILRLAAGQLEHKQIVVDGLFAYLGGRRDMRTRSGERSANVVGAGVGFAGILRPDDFSVVLMAMNDYLLRKKAGYCVFESRNETPQSICESFPLEKPESLRVDLDRRIEEYLRRYRRAALPATRGRGE